LKKAIRQNVLAERDRMPPEDRGGKSRLIEERLFALSEFVRSQAILFFASFRSEVETAPMIRRALESGKRVFLPRVNGATLDLCEIRDPDRDVAPGAWDIPEPKTAASSTPGVIDLIIVPGAAFDTQGNRVGYGAGFYDKLLSELKKPTVALAYEMQIVPAVPVSPHDVPVAKIITETRVITAKRAA
jgi:5-formyltetrahydrofolate cyclo-ligase